MRNRLLTLALGATLVLGALPTPVAAHHRSGPCALHLWTGESIRHHAKRVITCAADTWAVKGGATRAVCIAERESHLIPTAVGHGENDDYLGLFQQASTYWPSRYDAFTRPAWELSTWALNARSNAVVTIRMVADAGGWTAAGWPRKGC